MGVKEGGRGGLRWRERGYVPGVVTDFAGEVVNTSVVHHELTRGTSYV